MDWLACCSCQQTIRHVNSTVTPLVWPLSLPVCGNILRVRVRRYRAEFSSRYDPVWTSWNAAHATANAIRYLTSGLKHMRALVRQLSLLAGGHVLRRYRLTSRATRFPTSRYDTVWTWLACCSCHGHSTTRHLTSRLKRMPARVRPRPFDLACENIWPLPATLL
jgi:hypothetical protein